MAFVIADRVRETTTSTGTGSVTLAGAYTSFQTFSAAIGNGNNTYYTIASASSGEWEVGIGTYSSGGNLLSRDTVLASSNGGSLVTFTSGTKDVFVTQPSERSLLINAASNGLFAGNAAFTANGVPYANSTSTLTTGSALTFNGSTFKVTTSAGGISAFFTDATYSSLKIDHSDTSGLVKFLNGADSAMLGLAGDNLRFYANGSEQMRLTSTGLGIGTSSPGNKLTVKPSATSSGTFDVLTGSTNTDSIRLSGGGTVNSWLELRGYLGVKLYSDATNTVTVDSSGNLGLGVTPSAWASGWPALQVGTGAALWSTSDGRTSLGSNTFVGSGPTAKYIGNGFASSYAQLNGVHSWYIAPNNTSGAGATLTATQAMTLDASGRLALGTTTANRKFVVGGTAGSSIIAIQDDTTGYTTSDGFQLQLGVSSEMYLWNYENSFIALATNNTERARITSGGDFGIGTSSPATKLQVYGTATATQISIDGTGRYKYFEAYASGTRRFYSGWDETSLAANLITDGAHPITFGTSGTERMRLDSSGNLGIGTSSPLNKLVISNSGAVGIEAVPADPNGAAWYYYNRATSSWATTVSYANQHIWNRSGTTEAMRLDSSGNLGLGVTPSAWASGNRFLDVNASASYGAFGSSDAMMLANAYWNGSNWIRKNANNAFRFVMESISSSPTMNWQVAANGAAGSTITFTQAMTLDASGNLVVGGTSAVYTNANRGNISINGASTALLGLSTGGSGRAYLYTDGSRLDLLNTQNDALTFGTNNTERARIDSSGNLLVGTTSASFASGGGINVKNASTSNVRIISGSSTGFDLSQDTGGNTYIYNRDNGFMAFATNNTERARITSGGYFKASNTGTYLGSTGDYHELRSSNDNYLLYAINTRNGGNGPFGISVEYSAQDPNGTGNEFLQCVGISTLRAEIRSNGGLANYSANDVNLSDRREKTNFAPAKSYLDTICAIPVQTFNYIDQSEDDPGLTLGVVAQDVQAVAPELVMESNWGTKDDPKMRLSIYQTDLQYALMKALQELKSELDSVKAELAALKGA